ncbi:MAG: radical SAM protein [Desulfobacterales bacterium]|nr:radical SAM protein [Desulfobacterales bacterium]
MDSKCLHIMTSPVCNNHCLFCNDGFRDNPDPAVYAPETIKGIIRSYRGRLTRLNFTSGEPTLNPALGAFIKTARDNGFTKIGITTNGRMLSYPDYALALLKSGVNEIIISVHGPGPGVHDALTRSKGSFEQTAGGIANLSRLKRSYAFNFLAAVTLNRQNLPYLEDLIEFLMPAGPDEIIVNVMQPLQGQKKKISKRLLPRYSDVAKVAGAYYQKRKDFFLGDQTRRRKKWFCIIDLPICTATLLRDRIGYGETRIIENSSGHGCRAPGKTGEGRPGPNTRIFSDNRELKLKGKDCRTCLFDGRCNGIYKQYIELYGWEEFQPVLPGAF